MIKESLENSYSMYYVHGHSNPAGTELNGWFSAENVDTINTQLFAADGCYVGGWWSKQLDNNVLDPSIDGSWYGSKIFTSENSSSLWPAPINRDQFGVRLMSP